MMRGIDVAICGDFFPSYPLLIHIFIKHLVLRIEMRYEVLWIVRTAGGPATAGETSARCGGVPWRRYAWSYRL